ncbi:hypothetical protein ABBQ38_009186 [Trebouxia sp. C0009 RCD-2024]
MRCGTANLVTSPASVSSACLTRNAASACNRIGSGAGHRQHLPAAQLSTRVQTSPIRHGGLLNASATDTDLAAVSEVQEQLQLDLNGDTGFEDFKAAAQTGNVVPIHARIFSDHLTPVLAYRCLVRRDDRSAPSFLFEAVNNGTQQGRYSYVGAQPSIEIIARGNDVRIEDRERGTTSHTTSEDPMSIPADMSAGWQVADDEGLPKVFTGGWVGYSGYDTVRYVYSGKLPFSHAPSDDRQLPDMHMALYNTVIVFDQATKLAYVITWVHLDRHSSLEEAYQHGQRQLQITSRKIENEHSPNLTNGKVTLSLSKRPHPPTNSNMTKKQYLAAVDQTKEHIQAGDVFQLVLSQRFQRHTRADPFEIYRALRVVNPSPYMVYLQAEGSILVASSPEILCRLDHDRIVTNRPLAGTRRRGKTPKEDLALEQELLADEKECSEHVMLVDLGRNDVGKVAQMGSVNVETFMEVERYSHVMHISSTVKGKLLPELNAWDVMRAALPAGTVSGAPKVRAMQIIDELEMNKRGPYGGGMGYVAYNGNMDVALALRTMVIPNPPPPLHDSTSPTNGSSNQGRKEWTVHLQAGAGLVADSVPESEYEETVNKAAALGRAIDLAEQAFVDC